MENINYDYTDNAILPDDFDPEAEEYVPSEEPTAEDPTTGQDAVETETPQSAEEQATTPEPQATAPEPQAIPQEPQRIKVRFNHEEREMSYDEAVPYIQKGMNYDKMEQRVKELETVSSRSKRLAESLGYDSPEEMFTAAEENYVNKQVQELMDQGNTEAMARFLVEQRMAKAAGAAPQEEPAQEKPTSEEKPMFAGLTPERKAELDEFVRAYPGVTQLPDEVIRANQNGTRLIVAYERHKNQAALNELAILKQNQAAAAKAPVSGVNGKAAPPGKSEDDDPFLQGFNS